jgi:hypothetical protein
MPGRPSGNVQNNICSAPWRPFLRIHLSSHAVLSRLQFRVNGPSFWACLFVIFPTVRVCRILPKETSRDRMVFSYHRRRTAGYDYWLKG